MLCFETAYLGENIKKLLNQKVAQNITISLGFFTYMKNCIVPPKVASVAKKLSNLVTLVIIRSGILES
jgi:hypothetical protein